MVSGFSGYDWLIGGLLWEGKILHTYLKFCGLARCNMMLTNNKPMDVYSEWYTTPTSLVQQADKLELPTL